jgi:hypothetical protein
VKRSEEPKNDYQNCFQSKSKTLSNINFRPKTTKNLYIFKTRQ